MQLPSFLHAARQYLTPTLKSSAFLEKGQLTPEEFVLAGDFLTRLSPSWAWCRSEASKAKPYLPGAKQFLITTGIPCARRVKSLLHSNGGDDQDLDGGWVEPGGSGSGAAPGSGVSARAAPGAHSGGVSGADDELELIGSAAYAGSASAAATAPPARGGGGAAAEDDDEYGDLSSFMEKSLLVHDPAAVPTRGSPAATLGGSATAVATGDRVYELSICYDNYYRTPRVYLKGYAESGAPLSPDEMLEDVMQDYVNKTATMEHHPHLSATPAAADGAADGGATGGAAGGAAAGHRAASGLPNSQYISIHPCKHAQTMKRVIDSMLASAGAAAPAAADDEASTTAAPSVELYLFIFLKFIASMVPTMAYDNTLAVSVGSSGAPMVGGGGK